MEDLATDRIYRLMIAQRIRHRGDITISSEEGQPVEHTPDLVSRLFDEELDRLLGELPADAPPGAADKFRKAREVSERMITEDQFDPI
jgi:malate synthase